MWLSKDMSQQLLEDFGSCQHLSLSVEQRQLASAAGYHRPTAAQRDAAATPQGRARSNVRMLVNRKQMNDGVRIVDPIRPSPATFPAPLVLPHDDLHLDPTYPPQSMLAWLRQKDRNPVTMERHTIYVAAPPDISPEARFVRTWSRANIHKTSEGTSSNTELAKPRSETLVEYLAAFFGLSTKLIQDLCFTTWDDSAQKASKCSKSNGHQYVGLQTTTECVRICTRATPDKVFSCQLNLDDLLDAAMGMLPADAYALLLLVDQDMFESPEDDFQCGRAYGASRVAVVSTARYSPVLDGSFRVDREHSWPASHCQDFVHLCCRGARQSTEVATSGAVSLDRDLYQAGTQLSEAYEVNTAQSAMGAAVSAHSVLHQQTSPDSLSGLWLSRVCRTASHEMGHCFGIDHCVYYACAMQGTASITEDYRQPPYLCPIDLNKILRATGTTRLEQYRALIAFCERYSHVRLFSAYAAWLRSELMDI